MKITRALLLGLAFAATAIAPSVADTPKSLTVKMMALNASGENGTAVITQGANGINVVVNLTGAKGSQPTHIHIGTCKNLNKAPEYALQNTVDGKGTSSVPGVTIAQLLKGHYAINVHKSATDLATYVACGNITAS